MNSTTLVMGFSSVGLMVFGLALFVYQLALSPADEQPDVGVKGLKRAAIMAELPGRAGQLARRRGGRAGREGRDGRG